MITGQSSLSDVLIDFSTHDSAKDDEQAVSQMRGRLRVLGAGVAPSDPSELIASTRMREVLTDLQQLADLIIIDTNPLLRVGDSLPLLDIVSGVVLVARLNRTPRDAIRQFQKTIANTSATALGFVATGASASMHGSHHYGYGGFKASGNGNGNGNGKGSGNGHKPARRLPGGRRADDPPGIGPDGVPEPARPPREGHRRAQQRGGGRRADDPPAVSPDSVTTPGPSPIAAAFGGPVKAVPGSDLPVPARSAPPTAPSPPAPLPVAKAKPPSVDTAGRTWQARRHELGRRLRGKPRD